MELKKKAKFRIIVKDLATKKNKTYTLYEGEKKISFDDFVAKIGKLVQNI